MITVGYRERYKIFDVVSKINFLINKERKTKLHKKIRYASLQKVKWLRSILENWIPAVPGCDIDIAYSAAVKNLCWQTLCRFDELFDSDGRIKLPL